MTAVVHSPHKQRLCTCYDQSGASHVANELSFLAIHKDIDDACIEENIDGCVLVAVGHVQ